MTDKQRYTMPRQQGICGPAFPSKGAGSGVSVTKVVQRMAKEALQRSEVAKASVDGPDLTLVLKDGTKLTARLVSVRRP